MLIKVAGSDGAADLAADFNCCRSAPRLHSTDIQIRLLFFFSFRCVVSVLPIAPNTFREEQLSPPPR